MEEKNSQLWKGEKIGQLLRALRNDPAVQELTKDLKKPETDEEAAEVYSAIAKKQGFDIPVNDILESLKAMEEDQRIQTRDTNAEVDKSTLTEMDLDIVAGGADPGAGNPDCDSTYNPGEWCWFSDECGFLVVKYEDEYTYTDDDERDSQGFCVSDVVFDLPDGNTNLPQPDIRYQPDPEDIWQDLYGGN